MPERGGGRIASYNSTGAARILAEIAFNGSNPFTGGHHLGCAVLPHPSRNYLRFGAGSNGLSRLIQSPNNGSLTTKQIRVSGPEGETGISMGMWLSCQHLRVVAVASSPRVPFCGSRDPLAVPPMTNPLYSVCCMLMHCGSACGNTSPLTLTLTLTLTLIVDPARCYVWFIAQSCFLTILRTLAASLTCLALHLHPAYDSIPHSGTSPMRMCILLCAALISIYNNP